MNWVSRRAGACSIIAAILLAIAPTRTDAAALSPDNWGAERSALTSGPKFAKSKAICRQLGDAVPPAGDQPTPAQKAALKGCDAEALYYGQGAKPDYVKARLCAMLEAGSGGNDKVFGGSTILMQVYANGLGVGRNVDLATAFACGISGAPAESDGRVLHLQSLKRKPGHIDYCDDITSGLAEGFCQARRSDTAAVGRDARLRALTAQMPPAARALYGSMKKAFDGFVQAHGDGEVDLSGSARAAIEIEEQDSVRDQFATDLDRLLAGRWPKATAADVKAADADLNRSYRKALAWAASKNNLTTVKAEDVRTAERAWIIYRDAYGRFAAAAIPAMTVERAAAHLTTLRAEQLDALSN